MNHSSTCSLHLVSLQVPFPADYGGVIDIYYKLKALKEAGLSVWLHTYQYDRPSAVELEQVADRVSYYPRDCSVARQWSFNPYIVHSRRHPQLMADLLTDDAPILFEGLHCCAFLNDKRLAGRKKMVRAHNIEHHNYQALAHKTSGWKSLYYRLEAYRLKRYEPILASADVIWAITENDRCYFASQYPSVTTRLLPAFHVQHPRSFPAQAGDYILYHGNLSVEENIEAVEYLLQQVVPLVSDVKWIFAGKNPTAHLRQAIARYSQAQLIANPSDAQLERLIQEARANLLMTFQSTGLKLKLLHALSSGGTCIVNTPMLAGTDLASACVVADTPQALAAAIARAWESPFTPQQFAERETTLAPYENRANAQMIIEAI